MMGVVFLLGIVIVSGGCTTQGVNYDRQVVYGPEVDVGTPLAGPGSWARDGRWGTGTAPPW